MTPGNGPYDWRKARDERRAQRMQWHAQRAAWRHQHHGQGHAAGGIVLLIIGAVFLLNNLGVFYLHDVRKYWPVILIVAGAAHAAFSRNGLHRLLWSGMLMTMGGLLLAQNFGYIHGDVWELIWPTFLIFLGVSFLFRSHWRGVPPGAPGAGGSWQATPPGSAANVLNETSVFGAISRRIDSQEFEGGTLSSVFGGIEIDLRRANTQKDEIAIQADAVFGGIELTVPDHWRVTVQGAGVFGGFEDQTHPSPAPAPDQKRPHLIITGSAVFGGVSVKN